MNNFINRTVELNSLEELYQRPGAGLAIVYGRRRLGKTALLKQFATQRHHCYFMSSRAGEKLQINALGNALAAMLNEPLLEEIDFTGWDELFALFDRVLPNNDKFIFIIDEYQYLCQVQPAFSSIIQKWWDEKWSRKNLLLILCGSITSMMYKETLAHSAPLYGRASLQLLLAPIRPDNLPEFFPDITDTRTLVEFYAICGGTPRYMELLQGHKTFKSGLSHLLLNRNSILFNEAKYILQEEMNSPNTCWSILNALSSGCSKISELGSRLALPANQLTRYIDLLKDLFLVYREVPVLEKNPAASKRGIYLIVEPFLRLWFGCIYPYESFLEFDEQEIIMNKLQPLIKKHIAYCFEDLSRQYARHNYLGRECVRIGRQWGKDYEIDIAGVNTDNKLSLVGECKWSNQKVGLSILKSLEECISQQNLPMAADYRVLLFSKSGFTDELTALSKKQKNVVLLTSPF